MKVKDIMTTDSLRQCGPETKLPEAAQTMKARNCGALPVVDKNKKVVGIITDRDICLALAKEHSKPAAQTSVSEIMSSKVLTVRETEDLNNALEKMQSNQVGRLPVVNQENQLQGIVSLHTLLSKLTLNKDITPGTSSLHGENILKAIRSVTDKYTHEPTPAPKTH